MAGELRWMKEQSDDRAVRVQLVRRNGGLGTGDASHSETREREGHKPSVWTGHDVTRSCSAVRVTPWIGKVLSLPRAEVDCRVRRPLECPAPMTEAAIPALR